MTRLHRTANGLLGELESEVYRRLGTPLAVRRPGDEKRPMPERWANFGLSPIPARKITNKQLLYIRADRATAIYIGADGRVEAVDNSGT